VAVVADEEPANQHHVAEVLTGIHGDGLELRRIAVEGHVSRALAFPTDSGESMAIAQPVPADARMVATSLSIWVSISASLIMSSHNRARMPSLGLASLRIAIRRF
jgi:hypothetical protein